MIFEMSVSVLILITCGLMVVLTVPLTSSKSVVCSHRPPNVNELLHPVHIEPFHVIRKRSLDQPLRVFLHYDQSVYNLNKEKFDLIHNVVLPEAVHYWEKTLMVRQTMAPIRLNRRCKTDQVFFRAGEPHPYCQSECENQTLCGEIVVPEQHLEGCRVCDTRGHNCRILSDSPGQGIEKADFVFYISAMQTDRCHKGTVVAYAAHCQQEAALDRPIAGHANLCPQSISTKSQELETLVSTVKHEMLHALGFSVSLYAFFRDKDGYPLTSRGANGKPLISSERKLHEWSAKVARLVPRPDWKVRGGSMKWSVQMMVTPRVVEEARRHFDCPTLEGAELEDQGGEGTALTHWEKRIFENEAMTGTHTQNPIYSRVTLALMEDTGWYMPIYEMAENLTWGQGLGCDFVTKSCKDWMDVRESNGETIQPFCRKVKRDPPQTECMGHRRAVGLCNLVEYTEELPLAFQNFESIEAVEVEDVGRYGGSVDLADYCPYLQEFTWKSQNVVIRGSQCHYTDNNPNLSQNFALERYGDDSKCFNHGMRMWEERNCQQSRVWQHWGSGCYEYFCLNGRLHVKVLNQTYTCYRTKQQLPIQLFTSGWLHIGSIICPSCQEICQETGMKCLPDEKSTYNSIHHRDILTCRGVVLYDVVTWTRLQLLLISAFILFNNITR